MDWLCCDVCDGWYHDQCLKNINVVTGVIGEEDLWYAPHVTELNFCLFCFYVIIFSVFIFNIF